MYNIALLNSWYQYSCHELWPKLVIIFSYMATQLNWPRWREKSTYIRRSNNGLQQWLDWARFQGCTQTTFMRSRPWKTI